MHCPNCGGSLTEREKTCPFCGTSIIEDVLGKTEIDRKGRSSGTGIESTYHVGKTVNAVRDRGFSESVPIKLGDPHLGWELGQFWLTGYEALDFEESGIPVFYTKKDDPSFKLCFRLNFDIKKLNNTDKLQINEDTNGYDVFFNIPVTNFGYGALFIRRTDFKSGRKGKTEKRLNFLQSKAPGQVFVVSSSMPEGDYDAALDYELKEYYGLLGTNWWNYKIPFSFKVRYLSKAKHTVINEGIDPEACASERTSNERMVNPDTEEAFHDVWKISPGRAITVQKNFADEKMLSTSDNFRHGFAAERANYLNRQINSVFTGEKVKYIGSDNAKDGPDFMITDSSNHISYIQSKYYKTAKESVNACFGENGKYRYTRNQNEPMEIEVPKDQYEEAIEIMKEKIEAQKVPGVEEPERAKDLIRKGTVTYKQAVNIAKAGTVDSLKYDAAYGIVSAASSFGVSAIIEFAVSCWQNEPMDVALKRSILTGLRVGGNAFVVSVVSSQLSKTALNRTLIPASKTIVNTFGSKAASRLVKKFRTSTVSIKGGAAKQAAAKLLRESIITAAVSFVVLSVPGIIEAFQGRISVTQLIKNSATLIGGMGGGTLGAWGGATAGTAIAPGIGTVVGGIVGGLAGGAGGSAGTKAIADLIAQDDANEMIEIISKEYSRIAEDSLLSPEEGERVSARLQNQINGEFLKNMFTSKDRQAFADSIIEPIIAEEVNHREKIMMPSAEDYTDTAIRVLEAVCDEIEYAEEQLVHC